jgi:hypothetical protein
MDAQAQDELPPINIPLATLSGHVQKPTIEELQAALGLECLARAIEIYILQSVEGQAELSIRQAPRPSSRDARQDARVERACA